MTKNPGKIRTFEEIIKSKVPVIKVRRPQALHPCPCEPACTCEMKEPCLGCEAYEEWRRKAGDNG